MSRTQAVPDRSPVVLLVDDDETFLDGQATLLAPNYEIRTASGGEEALDQLDDDVDVVILDRNMPDMHGDDVAQSIRNRPERFDSVQVLMVTAVEPDVDIIDLGIDDYVEKPVTKAEMEELVERALQRQDYDESLQGYFSLANKRDVLADHERTRETTQFSELDVFVDELAREQLELRERQFHTLSSIAPLAVVTLDENGLVDCWNDAARELFGWTSEEVTGEQPPMFDGENEVQLEYARTQLFQQQSVRELDVTCQTAYGSTVDLTLSAAPLLADGELYGTMFVFRDVTGEKQRTQQVTVMNRALRHNIRNELNLLMGWLGELDRHLPEEQADHLASALDSARTIDQMAQKARDIQETLAQDRVIRTIDVATVLRRGIDRVNAEYPGVSVEAELPESATVQAIGEIRKAIWELLDNAIVHNDNEDVVVAIEISSGEAIDGTARRIVTIHDNGPGIPIEERETLFHGDEHKLRHGSGLGLWFVKWLVDRSDATLSFENSRFDRGTAVQIRFPQPEAI